MSFTVRKTLGQLCCGKIFGKMLLDIIKHGTEAIIGAGKDSDGDSWTKIRKDKTEGYVWPKYLD